MRVGRVGLWSRPGVGVAFACVGRGRVVGVVVGAAGVGVPGVVADDEAGADGLTGVRSETGSGVAEDSSPAVGPTVETTGSRDGVRVGSDGGITVREPGGLIASGTGSRGVSGDGPPSMVLASSAT